MSIPPADSVKRLKETFAALGYNVGAVDGNVDDNLKTAVRAALTDLNKILGLTSGSTTYTKEGVGQILLDKMQAKLRDSQAMTAMEAVKNGVGITYMGFPVSNAKVKETLKNEYKFSDQLINHMGAVIALMKNSDNFVADMNAIAPALNGASPAAALATQPRQPQSSAAPAAQAQSASEIEKIALELLEGLGLPKPKQGEKLKLDQDFDKKIQTALYDKIKQVTVIIDPRRKQAEENKLSAIHEKWDRYKSLKAAQSANSSPSATTQPQTTAPQPSGAQPQTQPPAPPKPPERTPPPRLSFLTKNELDLFERTFAANPATAKMLDLVFTSFTTRLFNANYVFEGAARKVGGIDPAAAYPEKAKDPAYIEGIFKETFKDKTGFDRNKEFFKKQIELLADLPVGSPQARQTYARSFKDLVDKAGAVLASGKTMDEVAKAFASDFIALTDKLSADNNSRIYLNERSRSPWSAALSIAIERERENAKRENREPRLETTIRVNPNALSGVNMQDVRKAYYFKTHEFYSNDSTKNYNANHLGYRSVEQVSANSSKPEPLIFSHGGKTYAAQIDPRDGILTTMEINLEKWLKTLASLEGGADDGDKIKRNKESVKSLIKEDPAFAFAMGFWPAGDPPPGPAAAILEAARNVQTLDAMTRAAEVNKGNLDINIRISEERRQAQEARDRVARAAAQEKEKLRQEIMKMPRNSGEGYTAYYERREERLRAEGLIPNNPRSPRGAYGAAREGSGAEERRPASGSPYWVNVSRSSIRLDPPDKARRNINYIIGGGFIKDGVESITNGLKNIFRGAADPPDAGRAASNGPPRRYDEYVPRQRTDASWSNTPVRRGTSSTDPGGASDPGATYYREPPRRPMDPDRISEGDISPEESSGDTRSAQARPDEAGHEKRRRDEVLGKIKDEGDEMTKTPDWLDYSTESYYPSVRAGKPNFRPGAGA